MSNVRCYQCNLVNFSTAATCRRCGSDLTYSGQTPPDQPAHNWQPANVMPNASYGAPSLSSPQSTWQGNAPMNQPYDMPAQYYAPQQLKQGLAIASLVCGLLGCLASIPGVICGILAIKKANKYPAEYGGKGMAIAGVVLSGLSFVSIPIIAAIAIPNLLASRQAANEASAMGHLRNLCIAETTYQSSKGRRGNYGSLEQLIANRLVDANSRSRSGYVFRIVVINSTPERPSQFEIYATPISYGPFGSGKRSFYTDETYVMYAADKKGLDADKRSPAIDSPLIDY